MERERQSVSKGSTSPEVSPHFVNARSNAGTQANKGRFHWKSPWIRLFASAALLGLLAWKLDLRESWQTISNSAPLPTIALILFFMGGNVYNGFRWWVLLRVGGQNVPLWPTLRLTLWSGLLGMFLPGLVGVELIRFGVMSRYTRDPAKVFCSVLVDRLFGMVSLFILVLCGCLLTPLPIDPMIQWLVIGAAALATFGSMLSVAPWGQNLLRSIIPRRLAGRLVPRMNKVFEGIEIYRQSKRALALSLVLAMAAQLIRVAAVIIADYALGIGLQPTFYFVIVPVTIFLEMVPLSLLGLGVREISMVAFFALIGESTETGFALSMFVFLTYSLSRLPGIIALMLEKDDVSAYIRDATRRNDEA